MIKKGTESFRVSPAKYFKVNFAKKSLEAATGETPSEIKCCEVCGNEKLFCETFCKYRSATYKEYLQERFG